MKRILLVFVLAIALMGIPAQAATVRNVKNYGAVGNGVTNDTAAIQSAMSALANGDSLYFPAGTYLVKAPSAHTSYILQFARQNITWYGDGEATTTIKIANGCPSYTALWFAASGGAAGNVSGLEVRDITFDQNVQNVDVSELMGGYPQITLGTYYGDGIHIHDVTVKNSNGVNCIMLNSNAGNVRNVMIEDVTSRNIGVEEVAAGGDLSFIYFDGITATVQNCDLQAGTSIHAPDAVCAIEMHGTDYTVQDNTISNFNLGIIVTGVGTIATEGCLIDNNIITGVDWGVDIWSISGGSKVYGLNGVTISNNDIALNPAGSHPLTGNVRSGIGFNNSNIAVNNLTIDHNTITAPLETSMPSNATTLSHGIGSIHSGITFYNSAVTNNTITNFPENGIRFNSSLNNVSIAGNKLTNCGSTLAQFPAVYKSHVYINAADLTGLKLLDNTFIDNLGRIAYFVYITANASSGFQMSGNTFTGTASIQDVVAPESTTPPPPPPPCGGSAALLGLFSVAVLIFWRKDELR